MTESFAALVDESLSVRLYGKKLDLAVPVKKDQSLGFSFSRGGISFARVYGTKIAGLCVRLPRPLILLLPDSAEAPAEGCEEFDPKEFRMWTVSKETEIPRVDIRTSRVDALLSEHTRAAVDLDFHFHDVSLNGTVVTGYLRMYLAIAGQKLLDRDDRFQIDFGPRPCVPLFSWGVASVSACYYADSRRLCGEGDYGVDLPWPIGHVGGHFTIACVQL